MDRGGESLFARGRSWWILPVLVPALALHAILALRFAGHLVDDAFISFRYAANLSSGLGPVFNAGERVEGYTNFLWVLLLAGGMKLGIAPESAARVLGFLAGAALVTAVAFFSSQTLRSRRVAWIPPVFVAVHPALAVWAVGGLETPLFAALVTWGVAMGARELARGRLAPASAALLGLASLTRPDGVLLAIAVGGVAAVAVATGSRERRGAASLAPSTRQLAAWAAVFLAIWLPWFLWRWSYYGQFLPNTFHAKVDAGGAVQRGLAYLHAFLWNTGYWLLLPAAGIAFLKTRREAMVIAAAAGLYTAYVVYVGGDGLPMYRFFVPVLGLAGLLFAWGIAGWQTRWPRGVPLPAVVVLGAALLWTARPNFAGPDHAYVEQDVREVAAWSEIGRWFRQHASAGESLAVLPAGAMPYYSGLTAVDMLGLNDTTIARTKVTMGTGQAGHEKYNVPYLLQRAPTYFVIGIYGLMPQAAPPEQIVTPGYPVERDLLLSQEFHAAYEPRIGQTPGGFFVYFARKGR